MNRLQTVVVNSLPHQRAYLLALLFVALENLQIK